MEYFFSLLHDLSEKVPLTVYSFIGGLVEEIVAPIPSPLVMTSAGSIAFEQERVVTYLILISLFAGVGKTIGAWVIYYLADKTEDVVFTRFGKFIGITHKEIESFGKRFNNTWQDDVLLVLLRAIPIFPGAPVAAVCGLIKLNMRTYLVSTFIGVTLRSMIFAFIGYYGLSHLESGIVSAENIGDLIVFSLIAIPAIFFVYKKRDDIQEALLKRTKKYTD